MYQYRLKETSAWIEKLIRTRESGTIIGLPMSGKLRTVESVVESLSLNDQFLVIDLSIVPTKFHELINTLQSKIKQFISSGGKLVYLENCSIGTKLKRKQFKALTAIRLELNRTFNYIFSFSEDITLKLDIVNKYSYLSNISENIYFFPYANYQETIELIKQNEDRFETKTNPNDYQQIFEVTGGIPYLIKSYFRNKSTIAESLKSLLSEFNSHQLVEIKNLNSLTSDSYYKLGLTNSKGDIISSIFESNLASYPAKSVLLIDHQKQKISINGKSIISDLNSYEKEIIFFLKDNRRISREQIAIICYGSQKAAQYSDYAIDKIMSRLRSALVNLGLDKETIRTNRGFGYSLNNYAI